MKSRLTREPRSELFGISLEKAWRGIHFLLTGQAESGKPPLAWAVAGDKEIPDQQKLMGYGAARILTSAQVARVPTALSRLDQEKLRRRFDVKMMEKAGLYGVHGEMEFQCFWAYLLRTKSY